MPFRYPATEIFHAKSGARRVVWSLEEWEKALFKEGFQEDKPEAPVPGKPVAPPVKG